MYSRALEVAFQSIPKNSKFTEIYVYSTSGRIICTFTTLDRFSINTFTDMLNVHKNTTKERRTHRIDISSIGSIEFVTPIDE